jgi:hypothetical protein
LLINGFLIDAEPNILDVSYTHDTNRVVIQVILLKGNVISHEKMKVIGQLLIGYQWRIIEVNLSREQYNEKIDMWLPKNYTWLANILFSITEII